jgi:predicted ATPase with chaperone activity
VADLEGAGHIATAHLAEALGYRTPVHAATR